MREDTLETSREIVDNFLLILSEWFHPDDKWEKIEAKANEFLFEDVNRALKQAEKRGFDNGKSYNMSDQMRADTKIKTVEEIMSDGIEVAIREFDYIVRGSEGETSLLFVRKVRDALNNLLTSSKT